MKQFLLIFACLLLMSFGAQAQMTLDTFDSYDSTIVSEYEGDYPAQFVDVEIQTDNKHEGTGAMRVSWQNQCVTEWGGWQNITHAATEEDVYWDFSLYTDFSIWYYVETPSSVANEVDLRIMLNDLGSSGEIPEAAETWISQHYILDSEPGWNNLVIPMRAGEGATPSDGFGNPNWGSSVANDGRLSLERIESWQIEWSQRAGLWTGDVANIGTKMDSVSGVIVFDYARLQGFAPVELVYFNGKNIPGDITMGVGWSGAAAKTEDEDADASGITGAIEWTGGAGWDAVNFTHKTPRNMIMNWSTDSLQFKIKAEAGIGDLTLNFWDVDHDTGKVDYSFTAAYTLTELSVGYDGSWKQVKVALTDFNRFAGVWDGDLGASVPGEFDSTEVAKFSIGNTGTAIATAVYFDDVWTGNPEFDFIPPAEVTGVDATAGAYYNLVYWAAVPDETDESYTVYASYSPITDISAPGVQLVIKDQPASEGLTATHWLQYPLEEKDVTFYYAVTCKDAAGNVGEPGKSAGVTNKGEAVPTIHYMPNFTFAADGDLSEWDNAGIMPWSMSCIDADNTGNTQPNIGAGGFSDSDPNDLSATTYMAIDDKYLYIAADVLDDVFYYDDTQVGSWWTQDALELFIGMWDQNGKNIHSTSPESSRGAEPDYKLIFLEDRYYNEYKNNANGDGTTPELVPDPDGNGSYYFEELGGADYVLEARIALDSIAFGDDAVLNPQNGMRIMFDLVYHDNDSPDDAGGGNLTWSSANRDEAYLYQSQWTNTWIGDTTHVDAATSIGDGDGNIAASYELHQNYPNPFNPETTIEFALAKAGNVEINVYNLLGQNVMTLVNQTMKSGKHEVRFDGASLSSGVYFYAIQAGDFFQTRKMILLK